MFGETKRVHRLGSGLGAVVVALGLLSLLLVFPWVVGGKGSLEVVKSAPETVDAGAVMEYTIRVTNGTGEAITDVLVSDLLPVYTTYVSDSMSSQAGVLTPTAPLSPTAGNGLTWTVGSLVVDESITMTFQVTVASPLVSGTHILNTATVSGTSDTATTTVHSSVNLTVTKTVTPTIVRAGQTVTYTIWITNSGNSVAEQVTVVDGLSPGFHPTGKTWMSQTVISVLTLPLVATAPTVEGTFHNWVTVTHGQAVISSGPTAPVTVVPHQVYVPLILKVYPLPLPLPVWHQGVGLEGLTVFNVTACPADCGILYASTKEDGVYQSQDGGQTWTGTGLAGSRVHWSVVQPDACGVVYVATWGAGVQKTTDGGVNWTPANDGLDDPFLYALAIAPDGLTLYAGTSHMGVYKSENGGGSWAPMNAGLPSEALVDALVIDPEDAQVVYAGTWGAGVFKSLDGGGGWSPANAGLGDMEIYALAVDPGDPQIVYAATFEQGVYRSGDGAGAWIQDGLPGQVAYTVTVDKAGLAYAGTGDSGDGNVVFQRSVAGVWGALAEQLDGAVAVRNLSVCELALQAGTANGAWWYGSD